MSAMDPPEKKRHGCFFYGCMTLLVIFFLAAVGGFLLVRYVAAKLNAQIAQYTDTQPMVFPKVEVSAAELGALQNRLAAFSSAVDAHSNMPPLVLSSADINALLESNTNFQALKDKCYVEIVGGEVKGQISLPLEKEFRVPLLHFKGRYLNGAGMFNVTLTNGALSVYIQSLEVKGKPLPEEFMAKLRGKNMAEDYNNNSTNAAAMSKFESIEVKDGKIIVKAKGE